MPRHVLIAPLLALFLVLPFAVPAFAWDCAGGAPDTKANRAKGICVVQKTTPVATAVVTPATKPAVAATPAPVAPAITPAPVAAAVAVAPAPAPVQITGSPNNSIAVCVWESSPTGGAYQMVHKQASTPGIAILPHIENFTFGESYLPEKNAVCATEAALSPQQVQAPPPAVVAAPPPPAPPLAVLPPPPPPTEAPPTLEVASPPPANEVNELPPTEEQEEVAPVPDTGDGTYGP